VIECVTAGDHTDFNRFSFLLADLINLVQNESANCGDFQQLPGEGVSKPLTAKHGS
jgi:hypothetical protein